MQTYQEQLAADTPERSPTECTATHICLCFDGNINRQVLLTAFSAAAHTTGALVVHFVCPQYAVQKFRTDLNALAERLRAMGSPAITSELHIVTDETFDALPDIAWLPKAACLRLLIASLLPQGFQRVIYLDCDIMVTADLSELYQMDMQGYPLAAVQDDGIRQYYCAPVGLDARHYFNSGMLLIDLAQWPAMAKRALDLFTENGSIYPALDQDVLNIVFKDNWLEVDTRWNTTSQRQPFASRWLELIWPDGWANEKIPPAVYHMTPFKPWTLISTSRYRFAYRKLARTLFEGGIETTGGGVFLVNAIAWFPSPLYRFMRLLWDAGLMVRHYIRRMKT